MTPLTVAEARAILIADEALQLSFDARCADGQSLGIKEGDAWRGLVESANDRVAAFDVAGYTAKRLTDEDSADLAELLRVSLDDVHFLAWHPRLREIREKMLVRMGDIHDQERTP
jgi:hypothetical protein